MFFFFKVILSYKKKDIYVCVCVCVFFSYHQACQMEGKTGVSGYSLSTDMARSPSRCAEGPPDYADVASAASERSQRQQNRQRFPSGSGGGLVFEL